MAKLQPVSTTFTHRENPDVPGFDDQGHVIFVDGECALCARTARMLAKSDRQKLFKIVTIQSETGSAVLAHYGLDPADPTAWLYLKNGRPNYGADGMLLTIKYLYGPVRMLRAGRFMPRIMRDGLYWTIAKNRSWLFGRKPLSALADDALKARLLAVA